MPFLCCRQSFGRTFASPPGAARSAMRAPRLGLQRGDVMRSFLYVIAILAMVPSPLLAQGNSAETPTQAPRPQPPVPSPYPPPHAGEGREGAPDRGNPRFVFHRSGSGFVRLDLVTGAIASCSQNAAGTRSRIARRRRGRAHHDDDGKGLAASRRDDDEHPARLAEERMSPIQGSVIRDQ